MVALSGLSPGRISKASFCMRNTGSRAAYVKAICFVDVEQNVLMDPNVLFVTPDKLVLKEGSQEVKLVDTLRCCRIVFTLSLFDATVCRENKS